MPAQTILTFDNALAAALHAAPTKKPRLLLGNGFSIAWDYATFSYGGLREKADLSTMSCEGDILFDALETNDFEVVIERLRGVDSIVRIYDPSSPIAARAAQDAGVLREVLAHALAANHPENVGSVEQGAYGNARRFLQTFADIYTLNYDLLLYWATMQDFDDLRVAKNDGFSADPDDPDAPYVTWDVTNHKQDVHYLHGALHLYDAGDRLTKLTWKRTSQPLIEQIRAQLDQSRYPLIVTEGTSSSKMEKILHSGYLSRAYRSLASISGSLFIYGHSLADNDRHILDLIVHGKLTHIFVSVFEPESIAGQDVIARASSLADERAMLIRNGKHRSALSVSFFAASSVRLWGK